jgi:hypothetical protein
MKKLVLLTILGIAAVSIWRWKQADVPAAHNNKLLADRIWIDHIPRGDRDTINAFVVLSEHSIGVFDASSQWRGAFELFRYEASGHELRLMFPQTGDREKVNAKAVRCDEGGMDFCLELDGNSRGVRKYYSRKGWEIDQTSADPAALKHRLDVVRASLGDGSAVPEAAQAR